MRPVNGARDALRLGRDVLALARVAMAAGEGIATDEIRWPVENAISSLRALPHTSTDDAAFQDVLGGLSELVALLDARSTGGLAV